MYEKVPKSEVPRQCGRTHAINGDRSELSTSQNDEGRGVHDIGMFDMEKKVTKLDKEGNTNDFNESNKEHINVSELMKRNLLKELDAQTKRIRDIENTKKRRDTLTLEINTKNKEI